MDYQVNSHKSKEAKQERAPKKIEKVISGEVVVKKQSFGAKFKSAFFGGDFKTAAKFVLADIVLPSARNMMADAAKGAVDRTIYGESLGSRRRSSPDYAPRVNYSGRSVMAQIAQDPRYRSSGRLPDQPPLPVLRDNRGNSELIFNTREDAEATFDALDTIIEQYDSASLADLYDLVGQDSSHVDNKWGWTFIKNAEIAQVRDGYLLKLPPMEAL